MKNLDDSLLSDASVKRETFSSAKKIPSNSTKPGFFSTFSVVEKLSFASPSKANKLGLIAASFVLFKSMVGMGFFSYPYGFAQAGYIYGTFLSVIVIYLTCYGMTSLTYLCSKIELKHFELKKINRYQSKSLISSSTTISHASFLRPLSNPKSSDTTSGWKPVEKPWPTFL